MAIWNVVYCLRMCMLDNKLQTFFNLVFYFNNFVDENFVEMVLCFSLHAACEQLETVF